LVNIFFIIFLNLFVIRNLRSAVLKVGGINPLGAILRAKGAIKPKGEIGGKTTQGEKRSINNNRSLS